MGAGRRVIANPQRRAVSTQSSDARFKALMPIATLRRCKTDRFVWPPGLRTGAAKSLSRGVASSSINQYRDLRMREYLDGLTGEDDRGHTVAAMRGQDDKVTGLCRRGIDDQLIRMLMFEAERLACYACRLRCI
jgi:hypothetical protein